MSPAFEHITSLRSRQLVQRIYYSTWILLVFDLILGGFCAAAYHLPMGPNPADAEPSLAQLFSACGLCTISFALRKHTRKHVRFTNKPRTDMLVVGHMGMAVLAVLTCIGAYALVILGHATLSDCVAVLLHEFTGQDRLTATYPKANRCQAQYRQQVSLAVQLGMYAVPLLTAAHALFLWAHCMRNFRRTQALIAEARAELGAGLGRKSMQSSRGSFGGASPKRTIRSSSNKILPIDAPSPETKSTITAPTPKSTTKVHKTRAMSPLGDPLRIVIPSSLPDSLRPQSSPIIVLETSQMAPRESPKLEGRVPLLHAVPSAPSSPVKRKLTESQ